MKKHTADTPAAPYVRVSSDWQDVDLSVAAQLRALRDYAKNGYVVVRSTSQWWRSRPAKARSTDACSGIPQPKYD